MYSAQWVKTHNDVITFKVNGLKYKNSSIPRIEHNISLKQPQRLFFQELTVFVELSFTDFFAYLEEPETENKKGSTFGKCLNLLLGVPGCSISRRSLLFNIFVVIILNLQTMLMTPLIIFVDKTLVVLQRFQNPNSVSFSTVSAKISLQLTRTRTTF